MHEVWDTDWLGLHEDARHAHPAAAEQARRRGDHDAARRRLPPRAAVRRRLVVAIAGVAAVAVLLLAVPLGIVLGRHYRDEELLRLQRDTVAATREIDVPTRRARPDRAAARSRPRSPSTTAPGAASPARARRAPRHGARGRCAAAGSPRTRGSGRLIGRRPAAGARARDRRGACRALRRRRRARRARRLAGARPGRARIIVAPPRWPRVLLGRRLARPLERLARRRAPARRRRLLRALGAHGDPGAGRGRRRARRHARAPRRALRRERAFSADASHQLRTPLQALRIELEALELRGDAPPEIAAAIAQVDRLARRSTPCSPLRATPSPARRDRDLGELLDDAESRWRGPLAASGRPLRVRVQTPAPGARPRRRWSRRCSTCCSPTPSATAPGAVTMTLHRRDGWLASTSPTRARASPTPRRVRSPRRRRRRPRHRARARPLAGRRRGRPPHHHRPGPDPTVTLVLQAAVP